MMWVYTLKQVIQVYFANIITVSMLSALDIHYVVTAILFQSAHYYKKRFNTLLKVL